MVPVLFKVLVVTDVSPRDLLSRKTSSSIHHLLFFLVENFLKLLYFLVFSAHLLHLSFLFFVWYNVELWLYIYYLFIKSCYRFWITYEAILVTGYKRWEQMHSWGIFLTIVKEHVIGDGWSLWGFRDEHHGVSMLFGIDSFKNVAPEFTNRLKIVDIGKYLRHPIVVMSRGFSVDFNS